MITADQIGAQYILAQDPDADRFSAAEKRLACSNFQLLVNNLDF